MTFLEKNSFLILTIILIVVIILGICSGAKSNQLVEGNSNDDGKKYLKKAIEENKKGISKIVNNFDSAEDVGKSMSTLQNMTNVDRTLNDALSALEGSYYSNIFGKKDSDTETDTDSDSGGWF